VRGFAISTCSQRTGTLTLPSPLFKGEAERIRHVAGTIVC